MNDTKPAYMRMYAWWMLLQNSCTLRFSDHEGINPRTDQEGAGFWSMLLKRSTPLYLDAACDRDFLLPGQTSGLQGCTRVEMRQGFAIQGRLLSQLSDATEQQLIPHPAVHFWTHTCSEPSCPAELRHWVSPSPTETTWEDGQQRTVIVMRGWRS